MKTFKEFISEEKIIAYHGSNSKWDWNDDEIPRNKFQRIHFSSDSENEAKKYGKIIHKQQIDTSNYKHVKWNKKTNRESTISSAIRAGHKGLIFHGAPDKTGEIPDYHKEIVTFDHKTIKKLGYNE